MTQEFVQSSEDNVAPQDFQNANAILDTIAQPKDSQPTKTKVKNFKNRVFQLLKIYSDKALDVNPLIGTLKQEMFFRQPQKMKQLVNTILNKQNITVDNLQQLLQYYRIILLYKSEKKYFTEQALNFVKILKKLASIDEGKAHQTVLGMLKSFAFERKCTLKVDFFFYLIRKYESSASANLKKALIQKAEEYNNDEKLRNAQKKQLSKLLQKLDKKNYKPSVKKQEQDEGSDDQIKAIPNKKIKNSKAPKTQSNKIQEEGAQNKQGETKQMTLQQKQKLQRIKLNKKKRNSSKKPSGGDQKKTNKTDQRSRSRNDNKKGDQKGKNHENKSADKSNNKNENNNQNKNGEKKQIRDHSKSENKKYQKTDDKPAINKPSHNVQKRPENRTENKSQPKNDNRNDKKEGNRNDSRSKNRSQNKSENRNENRGENRSESKSRPENRNNKFQGERKFDQNKKRFPSADRNNSQNIFPRNQNKSFDRPLKKGPHKDFNKKRN